MRAFRYLPAAAVSGALALAVVVTAASTVTYYATYKVDGTTATSASQTYTASAADTSAVLVTNSGTLTMTDPTISTTGDTSSTDNSSFYGLNAGLLVTTGSTATVTGGTITTTGKGANGAFAYGTGAKLTMTNMTIKCSGDGGHAFMATGAGTVIANNLTMVTTGQSSSVVATDRGSGTITVNGGTITSSGYNSASIYSTGAITVNNATMVANGAEGAVIEGSNTINVNNSSMTVNKEKWGIMVYQSMSGDAEGSSGTITLTGGSFKYTPTAGPLIYSTNATSYVNWNGVAVTNNSGVLAQAAAGNWGTSGSNGGHLVMVMNGQTLSGAMTADSISSLNVTLKNSSALTSAVNTAATAKTVAITMDATSTWTLAGNSYVTTLADSAGVSGSTITNITGNGYNLYYDATASANSYLASGTFTLVGGGYLLPKGSSTPTTTCSYTAVAAASSFVAAGGSSTVAVTTTSTCAWTATSSDSWLTISSGASGTGSGSVAFAVAANADTTSRTATLTVAGQTLTITQAAASSTTNSCTGTLSSTSSTYNATGGSSSITVTAATACAWTAVASDSWITVSSGSSGTGSGSVIYSVAAYTGTSSRTGTLTIAGATYLITQSVNGSVALLFVPVTPCRLVDTRISGNFGGTQLTASETRSIAVPSGGCSIPTTAAAYSLNVAVVPVKTLGYATLYPTGATYPSSSTRPLVSTVNSTDGRIKSNAAIVPAGSSGSIDVYVTNATDLVLDINGYFVPASTNSSALAFYPVTPCRLVDTRNATGDLGGPALAAGGTRTFPVRGTCNLPSTAQAYSLNLAAVPTSTLGYLTAWATGSSQPVVSSLNAPTGTVVSNAAIVPAGTGGSIDIYANDATHVVIDVNGYFAPTSSTGLSFYTTSPCRLVDTRLATADLGGPELAAATTRSFPLLNSACGLPSTAQAYSLSATVVPDAALGYLTLWGTGGTQPVVATLNASDGAITSNAAIVPAGTSGAISAYVTNATHLVLDLNGYFGQ
jgi:hypothetical protein